MVAGRPAAVARVPAHENHESRFMMLLMSCRPHRRIIDLGLKWRVSMKWETPTAVDFRFGMEITMYIANR
jgi:coenzyme PQQ precursor peptide PqqA